MRKFKVLLVPVVITALIGGLWFVFKQGSQSPSPLDDELLLQAVNEQKPELCDQIKTVFVPDDAQSGSKGKLLTGEAAKGACKTAVLTGHLPGERL